MCNPPRPVIYTPLTARVTLLYFSAGTGVSQQFHFTKSDGYWSPDALYYLWNHINEYYVTQLRLYLCPSVFCANILVQDIQGPLGLFYSDPPTDPFGAAPANPMPNNVALKLRHQNFVGTRNAEGRTFWFGMPRSVVSNGKFDSTWANNLAAQVDAMLHGTDELYGINPVTVSYCYLNEWRDNGVPWYITHTRADLRVFNLRKRLLGH